MTSWPVAGRRTLLLLLLSATLSLPFLAHRDLWAPDEPRYAEVARETLADGHWWFPHVNGRAYPDKPPLYFWLAALVSMPHGQVEEWGARLPSALFGLLAVALTFDLGRRLLGLRAATAASLILATCWLFAWMAPRANLDVAVCALALLCTWSAFRAALAFAQSNHLAAPLAWSALAGLSLAAGIMTKGPVILLPVLSLLALPAWRALRRDAAWRRALLLCSAASVAALAAGLLAWLLPAQAYGGYDPFVIAREHVLDRATEGRDHVRPAWYYLTTLPLDFLPWTPLALASLPFAWRRTRAGDWRMAALLTWSLVPLVVLSLIVEKRNIYMVPMLPAWSLLAGSWVAHETTSAVHLKYCRHIGAIMLLLAGMGAGLVLLAPQVAPEAWRECLVETATRLGLLAVALAGIAGAAFAWVVGRFTVNPLRALTAGALATAALLFAVMALLPSFDSLKSSREMGTEVAATVGDSPLAMYPRTWDGYVFYSGRFIEDVADRAAVQAFLARSSRPAFILAYEKNLPELPADGEMAPERVTEDVVGHRRIVLLRYDR